MLFAEGPGRSDPTCSDRDVSLPHVFVNSTAQASERMFSSGNERTPMSFPANGVEDAGYMMKESDKLHLLIELMNMNMEDKTVFLTITYDFVPGHPAGWSDVKPVWLDARQCGTSEVNSPTTTGAFVLEYDWVSTVGGQIIAAAGAYTMSQSGFFRSSADLARSRPRRRTEC